MSEPRALEIRAALTRCSIVGCGGSRNWGCPHCGVFFCTLHTPPLELRVDERCRHCGGAMELAS